MLLFSSVLLFLGSPISVSAALPEVTISGVAVNNSSAKVLFQPVPGAKDYRMYDVSNPNEVKYAGLKHIDLTIPPLGWRGTYKLKMQVNGLPQVPFAYATNATGPQKLDLPSPEIEWNGLGNHQPHTLVVEALDNLGPVPRGNLYNENNLPLVSPIPSGAMLGSNKGPTADGKTSTNGQGPYTNNPQVIARSQPFVVTASGSYKTLPSKSSATQVFFDTFDQSQASTMQMTARDLEQSLMSFSLGKNTPKEWGIFYTHSDVVNSMPFISSDHFMDMLFDGGSPGSNNPLHQGHGEMGMTPVQTADFSGGKMLHITMEVDGHMSGRRWMSMALSPANDPFVHFDPEVSDPFNASNRALFLQFFPGVVTLDIFPGNRIWGGLGQATYDGSDSSSLGGNGIAFDNRSRFDFFLTANHATLFKDGELIQNTALPNGMPFTAAKVYFIHYVYHTDQEENTDERDLLETSMCYPMNAYWFNDPVRGIGVGNGINQSSCGVAYPAGFGFRYSDERHWDNMGFEVLPASDVPTDFTTLASLVQPIAYTAPTFVTSGTPSPVVKEGDANSDGVVNFADLLIVLSNWLQFPGTGVAGGDFNLDTKVNSLDFGIWYKNLGS